MLLPMKGAASTCKQAIITNHPNIVANPVGQVASTAILPGSNLQLTFPCLGDKRDHQGPRSVRAVESQHSLIQKVNLKPQHAAGA